MERTDKSIITVLILAATMVVANIVLTLQSADAAMMNMQFLAKAAAPIATSGDHVYIAWWTNKRGNNEVMFKASTDNGKTFGDKLNLSNSSKSESVDVQIAASGKNVYVTWWERNQTSNEPVLRISTNNGETFGNIMKLSGNTTSGS
jgi:hypothetical protein